ncbi:hypothetical protein ACIQMJ_10835 [Actinosynnema sp. NPDC091369]
MSPLSAVELDRTTSEGWVAPPPRRDLGEVDGLRLVASGVELAAWRGRTRVWWHRCGALPRAVHVSGDRLPVLTETPDYHAWGHLGPALLLRPDTGDRLAELRGQRAAAVGGGRFVLGLEGYGTFETRLHDRDGALLTTWPTYGHYVPDADGVLVVECDRRAPTSSRLVRLRPDGALDRGDRLRDGRASAPVVLPGGAVLVLDAGVLLAVGRDLRATVLAEVVDVGGNSSRCHGSVELRDDDVVVTVFEHVPDASLFLTHRVRYALSGAA